MPRDNAPAIPDRAAIKAEMAERLRVAAEQIATDEAHAKQPITRERRRIFLDAISVGLPVSAAAAAAGISRRTAYWLRKHEAKFAEEWEDALDASIEPLEQSLEATAFLAPLDSMARVRAAETLLRGRSRRYRKDGEQGATVTLRQGETSNSISLRLGTPIPE